MAVARPTPTSGRSKTENVTLLYTNTPAQADQMAVAWPTPTSGRSKMENVSEKTQGENGTHDLLQ